jgi:hypothetical protein
MGCRRPLFSFLVLNTALALNTRIVSPNALTQDSSSSSKSKAHTSGKPRSSESSLDIGSVNAGVYRNSSFGFACKIPAGWVLRTEEMNAPGSDDSRPADNSEKGGRVLLAAFSRPPLAKAEDVNSSILIVAESVASYPGLKEAAQYFAPLTDVAKVQGFEMDDDPYAVDLGTKTLVRGNFQKDVGNRVMRQSTLVMLVRGYVVSFTFIGGTEDEVEELVQRLSFRTSGKSPT